MLTPEQLNSIAPGLADVGGETGARRAPRIPHRELITISYGSPAGPVTAKVTVRDVSVRGIGLMARQPMDRGVTFLCHFDGKTGRTPLNVLCTVCHSRALPGNLFAIGAEFTCVVAGKSAGPSPSKEAERISRAILT